MAVSFLPRYIIYQQEIDDVEIKSEPKRQQSIYGKGLQLPCMLSFRHSMDQNEYFQQKT